MATVDVIVSYCETRGYPVPEREALVVPGRKWRWDYFWGPPLLIAIELQGSTWARGRHTRGAGYRNDVEKLNQGSLLGLRVFWLTTEMLKDGAAFALLDRVLT